MTLIFQGVSLYEVTRLYSLKLYDIFVSGDCIRVVTKCTRPSEYK